MYWEDRYSDNDIWAELRIFNIDGSSPYLKLYSGGQRRLKLELGKESVLWGAVDGGHLAAWTLIEYNRTAEDIVPPIHSSSVKVLAYSDDQYYSYWSRYFARVLFNGQSKLGFRQASLRKGKTSLTKQENLLFPFYQRQVSPPNIYDFEEVFEKNRYIETDWHTYSGDMGLMALKKKVPENHGRLKYWMKTVRSQSCPPILVMFIHPLDKFIILDGHLRLQAFLAQGVEPQFLVVSPFIDHEMPERKEFQDRFMRGVNRRLSRKTKRKLSVKELNELIIPVFDNRPFTSFITLSRAKRDFETLWKKEVLHNIEKNGENPDDFVNLLEALELQ